MPEAQHAQKNVFARNPQGSGACFLALIAFLLGYGGALALVPLLFVGKRIRRAREAGESSVFIYATYVLALGAVVLAAIATLEMVAAY